MCNAVKDGRVEPVDVAQQLIVSKQERPADDAGLSCVLQHPAVQAAGRMRICFFLPSDSLMMPSAVTSPLPIILRSSLTA